MEKKFELKEMWFNNTDSEVVLTGVLHKEFLQYDTKVRMPIARLNALVNLLQKTTSNLIYTTICVVLIWDSLPSIMWYCRPN